MNSILEFGLKVVPLLGEIPESVVEDRESLVEWIHSFLWTRVLNEPMSSSQPVVSPLYPYGI